MDNLLSLRRSALIYGLCLPLAILLGYVLAQPGYFMSLAVIESTVRGLSADLDFKELGRPEGGQPNYGTQPGREGIHELVH